MTINNRFTYLRELRGLKQKQYADFLGITPQEVSEIETGKKEPTKRILLILKEKENIDLNWIFYGEGEPFIKEETEPPKPAILQELENTAVEATAPKFAEHESRLNRIEEELKRLENLYSEKINNQPETVQEASPVYTADYKEPEEVVELPLVLSLAAGIPIEAIDINETYPVPKSLIKKNKKYCVAKIKGGSMTDAGIKDGSYVLLEYCNEPVNGKIMVVRYGANTTLKLLHLTETGDWQLLYQNGSG
ncbi:S24 family peptidase, partial [Treponema pedis]|uniref:S24 family peptidase n=1 Tax=Treponema pedis TaxID=409322 RepID=UPI0031419E9A